jgi:Tfp pilus assembly protein PilF
MGRLVHPWLCALILMGLLVVSSAQAADKVDFRNNATMHANQGTDLMLLKRYHDAIPQFQLAIRLNPHAALSATLFNNLGICFLKVGQYPQAVASFQHAMRIQPGFEQYYENLVEAYRGGGRLPLAHQKLRNVVIENDQDGEAWFLLGLMQEALGEHPSARESFLRFLKLSPNSQLAEAAKRHL